MKDLQEFRSQYPQYDDMDDVTLADNIHRKFYSDLPQDQIFGKLGVAMPDSYGTVLEKAAENSVPASKVGLGGTLQAIQETPMEGLQNYLKSNEEPTGLFDRYKKGVQGMLGKFQIASTIIPALLTPNGKSMQEEANKELAANQPNVIKGSAKDYIGQATTSLAQNAIPLAASIFTQNPAPALGAAGIQGFGSSYVDQRNAGQSPTDAFLPSVGSGGAEVVMEKLPLGILMKEGGGLFARALKTVGAESATEALTQLAQDGIRKGTIDPNMTFEQMLSSAKDAGIVGGIAGGAMGAGAHGIHRVRGTAGDVAPKGGESATVESADPSTISDFNLENELNGQPTLAPASGIVESSPVAEQAPIAKELPEPVPTPSLIDKINTGEIDPNGVRDLLRNGTIEFKDGQLRESSQSLPNQSLPNSPQSVVDAVNSGSSIDPGVVRNLLQTGELQFKDGKIQTAHQLSPTTNIDTATSTLQAIKSGDLQNVHSDTIRDFVRSGEVVYGQNGQLELTELGHKLHTELNNPTEETPIHAPQSVTQELPVSEIPIIEDRTSVDQNAQEAEKAPPLLESATPQEEQAIADYQNAKQQEIPFSVTKKTSSPEFKQWFGDSKVVDKDGEPMVVYHGTNKNFESFDPNAESQFFGDDKGLFYFSNKSETANGYTEGTFANQGKNDGGNVIPAHLSFKNPINIDVDTSDIISYVDDQMRYLKSEAKEGDHDGIIINNSDGEKIYVAFDPTQIKSATSNNGNYDPKDPRISYSNTPSDKFIAQKDQLKTKVTGIIKKINPSANVNLVDKMFGEGEALLASGAKTTARQEVAGAYDKLNNVVHASLNTEKWNPEDTAYHEAYHSIRDMVSPTDDAILKKAFQGTETLSQEEHEAVEFGRFMTEKNAVGLSPAVRRIFLAIKEALRAIGRTLKLGKFNSVEDIFGRVESGDVYAQATKLKEALASANIDSIGDALADGNLTPEQIEAAVKEVSEELHNVVYSNNNIDENDRLNMLDVAAEASGKLEDIAYSITERVFSKTPDKEKVFKGVASLLSPVMTKNQIDTLLANQAINLKNTRTDAKDPAKMRSGELWLRNLVQSNDGSLRYVGHAYKSKTISKIADIFYHGAGHANSVGSTYFESIEDYVTRSMNKVGKALQGMNERDLDQVTEILQNPTQTVKADDKVKNAAKVLGQIIKDQRAYLEDAGLKLVSQIEGYFPRVYDAAKIIADTAGFLKAAVRAYQETYDNLSYSDAMELAEKWLNNILIQDQMGGYGSDKDDFHILSDIPPAPDETKSRVLTKEADGIMRDYLMRNPVDVMASSIGKAARAAEFNRRFIKDDAWKKMKANLREEGVDEEGVRQIMDAIRTNVGMRNNLRGAMRDVNGLLRYWSNLSFLSRTAFSSLAEGFTVATKTGDPRDGLRTMYDGFRAALETKGSQAMRDMSDMYGITGELADDMMMAQRTGGDFTSNKLAYKNKQFFKTVGVTQITSGQLSATFRTGQFFIGKLAEHIVNNHNRKKSSEFLISELGIPKDKMEEFSKWVNDNGGGKLDTEFGLGNSEMAGLYRTALRRFVHTTIQVPTAATRQRYASTPMGQFAYGLTSYINAYSKNVLIRQGRIAKEIFATDKGYTGADRAAFAMQVAMLPVLMLMAAGVGELKDQIFPSPDAKEKTLGDHAMLAASRGSVFGSFDPLVNLIGSIKYQKDPLTALDGPLPSLVSGFIKAAINLFANNSDNTNTAERNAMKQTYGVVIAPLITSVLATNNVLPAPYGVLAYGAVQAINSPQVKGLVTDVTAGEKRQP